MPKDEFNMDIENTKKISPETLDKNIKYMTDGIGHVIDTFEKRFPGSKGEADAQEYFVEELDKICDTVVKEEFTVHPNAFMDWLYITPTLLFVALAAYFIIPVVSIVLVVLALFPFVSQLLMYKTWMDPLYKKATSSNVYGSVKPTGEIKRRVILGGHTDAAMEWTWHRKFGVKGLITCGAGTIVGAFYIIGISIIAMVTGRGVFGIVGADPIGADLILGLCGAIFIPFFLMCYFWSNKKVIVDGANDNLSANFCAAAVVKALKEEGIKLKNTELCVLMTGSEEIGLRGAKAFAKAHKEEHLADGVETIVIALETLREIDQFHLYTKDLNATVKTDKDVAALVREAGKMNGVDIPYAAVTLGATDSAAFAQAGYKSTCLIAMSHDLQDFYHTHRDTKDNISPETMGKALEIVVDAVLLYDEKGL
jgi:hypothetical protein